MPRSKFIGLMSHATLSAAVLGGAVLCGPVVAATESLTLEGWSREVWDSAKKGETERVFELIDRLQAESDVEELQSLNRQSKLRREHQAKAEQDRDERLAEIRTELQEHIDGNELSMALRSAVELHALSRPEDQERVLASAKVLSLVEEAEADAKNAEANGEWLEAHELFLRLHLLYETDARYKTDIERVSARLAMLRFYAPKKLHEMRDEQRAELGEDPLPPFNSLGESWNGKVSDINRMMVVRALNTAHNSHVDDASMSEMLVKGLRSVQTLATITDLDSVFPGIGDTTRRTRFVALLDAEVAQARAVGPRAGYLDLRQTVDRMLKANASTVKLPNRVILHEFGNGAMSSLDDFSSIIWPDELRRFERSTQGRFTGVGIQISLDEANRLKVVTPLEGTPAQRAGIRRDDIIAAVDGESTLGITLSQAVDLITGDPGTFVTLSVERENEDGLIEVRIARDVIPIYSVKGWKRQGAREDDWDWFIDRDNGIGYVRVTQFSEDTSKEMTRAIRQMKGRSGGLNGLILDLRFNPGGLLDQAVNVANLFVDQGMIVSQHDGNQIMRGSQHARPGFAQLDDIPVVVLINEGSASASEIVAGCLQDYDKAILVGARSFGKGSVQNVYPLDAGSAALKLTTQYYRLPLGRLIHRRTGQGEWGVEPDVTVEMLPGQISEALLLRQDADLSPELAQAEEDDEPAPDPERLLSEGIDPQLEAGLLILQTQTMPRISTTVMLDGPVETGS